MSFVLTKFSQHQHETLCTDYSIYCRLFMSFVFSQVIINKYMDRVGDAVA